MTGPSPIDTIREALTTYAHSQLGRDALAALTELEQQLAAAHAKDHATWQDAVRFRDRAVAAEDAHKRAFEENRQLASRNAALEDRTEAAETALAEAERLANEALRLQIEARAQAIDLADALDRIEAETQEPHVQTIARAALDQHTHHDEAVT